MKKLISALGIASLCALPLTSKAAAYIETTVTDGGTITGKVTGSKDYAPKTYRVTKDDAICGEADRVIDFVKISNGALQETVVYLEKVESGKPFPPDVGAGQTIQEKCEFKPFVSVMRNGAKFTSINKDPLLHNVHTYEILGRRKKTIFNVSQPNPGTLSKVVKLKRGGPGMVVECDAHEFMRSYVFVAKNPYFAMVSADGTYKIDNVPPGKYTIKAWHGYLWDQEDKVEVKASGSATVNFTFAGTRPPKKGK
ncbi:hypothetical protein MNBD_GAMMA26-1959 [hydrothermal vent metagenome]|uniref:Rhamnogalacturonan lyase domain-containing protein n=1 Tax=hydrothermal vent metagenome TaxID=652676 RepID=A0A3B1BKZ1_9ZZZZ